MAWTYDDEEIFGIIDANIKDAPPNPPAVNTASIVRQLLKSYWSAMRSQVALAVEYAENFGAGTLVALPADSPVGSISIYNVSTVGTYANFGNVQVTAADIAAGMVQIRKQGAGWIKHIIPLSTGSTLLISANSGATFFTESGFYNNSGVFTASANWRSAKIDISVSGKFGYTLYGAGGANAISFFDGTGTYISGSAFSANLKTGEIAIPANAKVAKFSTQLSNLALSHVDYSTVFNNGTESITYVGKELGRRALAGYAEGQTPKTLAQVDENIGRMLMRHTSFITDGFYATAGNYNSAASFGSVTVEVENTKVISYSLYSVNGARLLTFFDQNNVVVGFLNATATLLYEGTMAVPAGAVRLVASVQRANGAGCYIQYYEEVAPSVVKIKNALAATSSELTGKADAGYAPGAGKSLSQLEAMLIGQIDTVSSNLNVARIQNGDFPDNGFFTTTGVYNTSANWGSKTITVIPGRTFAYNLFSAGGAKLFTFFNSNGGVVSSVNSGSSLTFYAGNGVVPLGAAYVIVSVSRSGAAGAYFDCDTKVGDALKKIQDTMQLKSTGKLIRVSKVMSNVQANVYNTIAEALANFKEGDTIIVYEGLYNELSLQFPKGIIIKGSGFVHIAGYQPKDASTADISGKSTIDWKESGWMDGIKVTSQNMRYPIHSDFGGINVSQRVTNCWLEHYGNSEAYNHRVATGGVPGTPASVWLAQSAWGCGTNAGSRIEIENTYMRSPMRAFSTHNNLDFHLEAAGPSFIKCKSCEIISDGIALNGTKLPFEPAVCVQSLASKTPDVVELENCIVNGVLVLMSSSQDHREFTQSIGGSGNSSHLMQIRNTAGSGLANTSQTTQQNVFILRVNSKTADDIVVSGNIKEAMFGNMVKLKGSTGLNSWVKAQISSAQTVSNVIAFSGNRTIGFTSGVASVEITMNAAYASPQALVDDMNAKLGSAFTAELYWPGFDYIIKFINEVGNFVNKGATGIPRVAP